MSYFAQPFAISAVAALAVKASAKATSPESYAVLKKYIPKTVEGFEEIYSKLTAETLCSDINFHTEGSNSTLKTGIGNVFVDPAELEASNGEYILVFRTADTLFDDGYFRIKNITLEGINCIKEADVTIDRAELDYSETAQISVTPYLLSGAELPQGAYEVSYDCNFPDVATVDETGLVTAVGDGDCIITVTISDGINEIQKEIDNLKV